eukprot:2893165-Rhodomonas_salina.1
MPPRSQDTLLRASLFSLRPRIAQAFSFRTANRASFCLSGYPGTRIGSLHHGSIISPTSTTTRATHPDENPVEKGERMSWRASHLTRYLAASCCRLRSTVSMLMPVMVFLIVIVLYY